MLRAVAAVHGGQEVTLLLTHTEPPSRPMAASMVSSKRQSWNTPDDVLRAIRRFDAIGLDPCSNSGSIVGARTEWRLERDGDSLTRDWTGHGLVFVNPPYSRWLKRWMAKCSMSGAEVISLTPARTDTTAFQSFAFTAEAICFWAGRMTFLGATAPAPFPSALCYWPPEGGESRVERFREIFGDFGLVVRCPHRPAAENSQIALDLGARST